GQIEPAFLGLAVMAIGAMLFEERQRLGVEFCFSSAVRDTDEQRSSAKGDDFEDETGDTCHRSHCAFLSRLSAPLPPAFALPFSSRSRPTETRLISDSSI